MITFWIIIALLILLALWFILPALLHRPSADEEVERREANILVYKDQQRELDADLKNGLIAKEQYEQEKAELERRLLEDVGAAPDSAAQTKPTNTFAYAVAGFIPVAAIALYFVVGNPKAITSAAQPQLSSPVSTNQANGMSAQQIAANTQKLADRLKQNPNDIQGWTMLARSYMMQENFPEAASAYEKLTALSPNDADAWADYAEALALANDQSLAGKPTDAINRALRIDPKHQKALDLAGSAAFQAKDYQKAIMYWQQLLKQLPAGSEELQTITEQISKAKELAGNKPSR
ncbi:MAG TPA: c-type cytochrome biogenesis protein CcmI [Pyrinomonadaceae bacterium]|jgi:cytochrome c-type biogenesis protein CcmH|nr:c-type cytochrome biogenesis protein CcmI [Pyrinomonadaceae bacterium]